MQTTRTTVLLALVFFVSLFAASFFSPSKALAQSESCKALSGFDVTIPEYVDGATHTITAQFLNLNSNFDYYVKVNCDYAGCMFPDAGTNAFSVTSPSSGDHNGAFFVGPYTVTPSAGGGVVDFSWTISNRNALSVDTVSHPFGGKTGYNVTLVRKKTLLENGNWIDENVCSLGKYIVTSGSAQPCGPDARITIWQEDSRNANGCYFPGCMQRASDIWVEISGLKDRDNNGNGAVQNYTDEVTMVLGQQIGDVARDVGSIRNDNGTALFKFTPNEAGPYSIEFKKKNTTYDFFRGCGGTITVKESCGNSCQKEKVSLHPSEIGQSETPFKLCDQIADTTMRAACEKCATDGVGSGETAGVWTAVGCIKREPTQLVGALIQIGLSIAGGVALLMILAAGFILTTSQGEPKKASEAREMITAAVVGLLFIIFSVTILQYIGFNILKIPGFGG